MPNSEMPKMGSPKSFDKNRLLEEIWGEKREKLDDIPGLKDCLYLFVKNPSITLNETVENTIKAISTFPVEKVYYWAKRWGFTRVAYDHEGEGAKFLYQFSDEANKQTRISTTKLITPSQRLVGRPEGREYFILINDVSSTLEGVLLQTARMVDELIWCLGLNLRKNGLDDLEAYSKAIDKISKEGFDIYPVSEEEILSRRNADKDYAVRIYGNINKTAKVPKVIGAVGPIDKNVSRPQMIGKTRLENIILEKDGELDYSKLVSSPFLNMGLCVAKRPHLGHMLLAGVVETARRSIGDNIPIVIHANDVGPRISRLITVGARTFRISEKEMADKIEKGEIGWEIIESMYRRREEVSPRDIVYADQLLKTRNFSLTYQTNETHKLFKRFFEEGSQVLIIPESKVPRLYGIKLRPEEKMWGDLGFTFTYHNEKFQLLESGGQMSAAATRAAASNYVSELLGRSRPIYIDADISISQARDLVDQNQSIKLIQYPGAAIGFDFNIASGTKGNSELMSNFLDKMKSKTSKDLLDDIVFLINTRYQLENPTSLPFFNYSNLESFYKDLEGISEERKLHFVKSLDVLSNLRKKVRSSQKGILFSGDLRRVKRLEYIANNLFETFFGEIDVNKIFLKKDELLEGSSFQSYVDRRTNLLDGDGQEALMQGLLAIASGKLNMYSKIVEELNREGYFGSDLADPIRRFVKGRYRFTRINNIHFNFLNTIEKLTREICNLDKSSADKLIEIYSGAYNRLFAMGLEK